MKEIVIMADAKDPERKFISALKALFPECSIRIVHTGSDRGDTRIGAQTPNREMGKVM